MSPVADFCAIADADGDDDAVISGAVVPLGVPVVTVMVPESCIDADDELGIDDDTIVDIVVAVFFITMQSWLMPLPDWKKLSNDELGIVSVAQADCAVDCTPWRLFKQPPEHGFVARKSDIWHPEMVSV